MTTSDMPPTNLPFVKAHGTGNDFVVIDAVSQDIDFTPLQVALLCDRHRGLGADGLLRIALASEFGVDDAKYFMDYRNADGSIAETCGNGLRVFARMLVELGYEEVGTFRIGTRAGTVTAVIDLGDREFRNVAIGMGQPNLEASAATVTVSTEAGSWIGVPVFMPNPHCVSLVEDSSTVGTLHDAPVISPLNMFPAGANVEFVSAHSDLHILMRTHERGVGETLSCGSGACAAASVWAINHGLELPWTIRVDVLGGTVFVDCDLAGRLTLRGPATVVAKGIVQGDLWTS